MAGLFETIGQSARGTAKAMAYAAIGPDILTAYAAAGALGTTIVDTGKEVASATKKIAGVGEKQKEALEDLKDSTQKQTTIFTSMRDILRDIVSTNKEIKRAEQQKKSKQKYIDEEAQAESKPNTSVLKTAATSVKDAALGPLGKLLLALGLGTLAWNTLLDDETKQQIKDNFAAFVEGLTGINFEEIQEEWNEFKNKLGAATALLITLARLTSRGNAAAASAPPPKAKPKAKPKANPEAKSAAKPAASPNPKSAAKPAASPNPKAKVKPKPKAASPFGYGTETTTKESKPKPKVKPKVKDAPKAKVAPKIVSKPGLPAVYETVDRNGVSRFRNAAGQFVDRATIARAVAQQGTRAGIMAGLKNIPAFGILFTAGESAYRGFTGDTEGAGIAAAQLMGAIPSGVTNAGAIGLAALNLARDVFAVSYGKYPTFRNVEPNDPTYVNVNDPEVKAIWDEVYNTAYEYIVGTTGAGPTRTLADFERMSQSEQLSWLGATNEGVRLAEEYGRGTAEYRNALQSYRERVLGASRGMSGEGGGADLRSSTNLMDINNSMAYNVEEDVLELIPDVSISTDVDDLTLSP